MSPEQVKHIVHEQIAVLIGKISNADVWLNTKEACKTVGCTRNTLKEIRDNKLKREEDFRRKNQRGDVEYKLTSLLTKI